MLQRLPVLAILALVGVLAFDISIGAQTEAKKAFGFIEQRIQGIEQWKADEIARLAEDMRKQEAEWEKLRANVEGIVLESENKYLEATKALESAVKDHEAAREQNLLKQRLYIENLYKLGALYAEMCDFEKAEDKVRRGWRAQQTGDAAWQTSLAARIRGALTVAAVLQKCDKPHEAARHVDICMSWCEQLPKKLYQPDQNSLLASCLLAKAEIANSTGQHHAAHEVAGRAIPLLKATGPKRHPDVAAAIQCQAIAAIQLDRAIEAYDPMREAQGILEKHYDKGHPSRAAAYRTMAHLQFIRGNELKALKLVDEALGEYERLFPEEKYPRSHPGLLSAMTTLGDLSAQYGHGEKALKFHRAAWRKCQRFYPQAHVNKLTTLLSYARSLRAAGQVRDALDCAEEAEAMACELDAKLERKDGANVAQSLLERGLTLAALGDDVRALATLQRSVDIYMTSAAMRSNPNIAVALHALGTIFSKQNELLKARAAFKQAMALEQASLARFAGVAAEAEAMAFRGTRDQSYHAYLAAGIDDPEFGYEPVWTAKATVTRLLQKRRLAVRLAQEKSPDVRQLQQRLIDVSTQLGRLIRSRRESGALREELLKEVDEEKEALERALAKKAPYLDRRSGAQHDQSGELAKQLPPGSVFVDLVYYEDFLKGETPQHRYAAFVMAPGQPARRVDLGPALPINRAVAEWRESIKNWDRLARRPQQEEWQRKTADQASDIHRLVWAPLARCFPPNTRLIYVAPDGDLARFPFAALPGTKAGSVLLDEVLIAQVPHGPFLLEQLVSPQQSNEDASGPFLAVGGVEYEASRLPGTAEEMKAAQRSAGTRETVILEGKHATSQAVRDALPQVRYAHLGTHGYLAEKELAEEHKRVTSLLRSWRIAGEPAGPSPGLGRRSPLSYTGLALAGAGKPHAALGDDGILSGESIAQLPLDKLRLVVLSACETGLGERTAGEGVQGLQRAFHLAGCPNVIATLWPVDDAATQVLMSEFYRQLWEAKKSPLEALCLAQHRVLRDPRWAPASGGAAHAKYWAAFVYSGAGAPFSLNPDDPRFGVQADPSPPAYTTALAIGGLLAVGIAAAFVAQRWRRKPLPVATIVGPADEADPTESPGS